LFQSLDDAKVALGAIVEHLQRRLVFRAVMGLHGLRDALELDDHDALFDAGLVGRRSVAAGDVARAVFAERRAGELGIGRKLVRILDRTIRRNQVTLLRHFKSPLVGGVSVENYRFFNAGITSLAKRRNWSWNSLGPSPSAQWIMKCS